MSYANQRSLSFSVFLHLGWHVKYYRVIKMDYKCSQGKVLSLYYLGDLLVQINSFSWEGFGGSCETAVLATGSCTLANFIQI